MGMMKIYNRESHFWEEIIYIEHLFGFQLENNKVKSDNGALLSGSYAINSLFYKFRIDKEILKWMQKRILYHLCI